MNTNINRDKKEIKYVILGAGLNGLTTAYALTQKEPGQVMLIEKNPQVGGLCQTISRQDSRFDLGSHRLHKSLLPRSGQLIQDLVGKLLMKNVRGGQLRLNNRYMTYPITSFQFLRAIGLIESIKIAHSLFKERLRSKFRSFAPGALNNYEDYLIYFAGKRAYKIFYKPYAQKVWGIDPHSISTTAVKKRVSMTHPLSIFLHIFRNIFQRQTTQYYYYFKGGIGTLVERLESEVLRQKGIIRLNCSDYTIHTDAQCPYIEIHGNNPQIIACEKIIATIPFRELLKRIQSAPRFIAASPGLQWRGLKLVYLKVKGEPQQTGETFYFPELRYPFGRVSLPRRFDADMHQDDADVNWFVCEVPVGISGIWDLPDQDLYRACFQGLLQAALIDPHCIMDEQQTFAIYLEHVYPVYTKSWQTILKQELESLAEQFPYLYCSGKLGLFLHNNIDQTMELALTLVDALHAQQNPKEWVNQALTFHQMKLRD